MKIRELKTNLLVEVVLTTIMELLESILLPAKMGSLNIVQEQVFLLLWKLVQFCFHANQICTLFDTVCGALAAGELQQL